ncbi:adhesion G-protein coupled receptor D2 isoform X2 [Astyanax mexicanus]|uniref:Adhesion G-protein coupled receptor D2 isoform X2 n=1 Tax=Astyanax mexicanus TaxID=7994 RepID=A0A8T2LNQ6_ASTMX|nr:adhesion G-protein coupled receptor D2 isoform X2 [Astyanax mexicanus]
MVLDGYDSGMRTGLRREEKKRHLKSVYVITQTYAPSPTSWVSHKHSSTARQMCENTHHRASHSEKQRSHNQPTCFYGKMHSVLLMVILISAMVVGVCEPVQPLADAAQRCFIGPVDPHTHVLLTSDTAYQLVNTSCSFSQAWHFCQSLFSSLTVLGNREDEMGTRQVLNQANMQSPVWMRISNGHPPTTTQTLSKQRGLLSALSFSGASRDGHARAAATFPPLAAASVCARVQFDGLHQSVSALFSYATRALTNEFQLRARPDEKRQRVLLALIVHGRHHAYRASFPNDARWHHVCVTWRKSDGSWAVYVDGKKGDGAAGSEPNRDMHGNGIFILGQDQDSFGGNFTEPFVGNITDVNVWDVTLNNEQVRRLEVCSRPVEPRPFLGWHELNLTLHEVTEVPEVIPCPGLLKQEPQKQEDCRILDSWAQGVPQYSTSPCSHTLPFICKTSKDRYMKKKEMEESLTAHPSPFMQHLSQHGVTTNDVLGKPGADRSWSSVSNLLNISERYLRESREQLESRDFPSLVQILSQAAELPSADNRSHVTAHTLSRNFIGLADALISQENANKWHAIREVVSGPMAVVQTIDRMVTNLSPLLLEDADSAQFHFNNIRLQVQQKSVSESSAGSEFCSANLTNHSELDCISVPPQSIQELYNNGFQKVTVLSTWYNSLTPLMNTEENVTTFPVITDSSVKYMGTVLGSSVISSAVMGNGQLISLGVQYTLRHRSKNTSGMHYNPVCAFWDFSLMPEDGGGWSTEGCEIISSAQDSTSCYCNHTTNFALLLQIYDVQRSQENEKGLQILSFIGCGVSLCGLIFTFILFVAVGVPKSDRTTVHKNLIAALAIAQLLLIFSYWASANQELCLLVTALLHLFFLSSFCWMLVEGLLLWSKVVSVNISEDRRMRFYYALGWGLPVLIVAITLTVSLNKYKAEQHCWLNTESDIIWAFVGPVLFVLAVNTVVLCRVVVVTVSSARRRAKMLAPSSVSKPHTLDLTWAATRPVLILLPVLGLTWLCGILVHLSVVLAYLFIILNAFQGLYIFLVYAVYNSEVQNAIKRIQEKRKALSFTNCSQPILPSQKTPGASWVDSLQTSSSPESSSTSHVTNSTSSSLIFKNESFGNDSLVSFSFKPAAGNQVVQLMAFKPSGKPCLTFSCLGLTVM